MSPESVNDGTDVTGNEGELTSHFMSDWGAEPVYTNYEVSVTNPENKSIGLGKYTVYLVSGRTIQGSNFSTRKRYSDFEWLRSSLVLQFPGVFIPPIPRKKKVGRFEKEFIECRRRGLEEFLRRVFNRDYLANSDLVRTWLNRGESGMESLKREEANRPLFDIVTQYFNSFDNVLIDIQSNSSNRRLNNRFSVPNVDVSVISQFSQYLESQFSILEQLCEYLSTISSTGNKGFNALRELSPLLSSLVSNEQQYISTNSSLYNVNLSSRLDLSPVFQHLISILSVSPQKNYDILQSSLTRELNDTECILEAVQTLEKLQGLLINPSQKIDDNNEDNSNVSESLASIRSTNTTLSASSTLGSVVSSAAKGIVNGFSLFSSKSRESSFSSDGNLSKLDRYKEDQSALRTLLAAGRVVLVIHEMPHFFSGKIQIFNNIIIEFVKKQMNIAYSESEFWNKIYGKLQTLPQYNSINTHDNNINSYNNNNNNDYSTQNNQWANQSYNY
ncbi:PX domain-containing protein [Cryptosporidium andersoni]|uniref:PX domain-containing protein n=1 Tax=Cryptosporidium andersoni TaxID=117008 RepID=A0A1J4MXW5_9CRYT|nr:PX domain-containing protein [Cryptosporidium andersoni]